MPLKELIKRKPERKERRRLVNTEGWIIAALLWLLRISVEIEGTPVKPLDPIIEDESSVISSNILILAGFFHTSHLDALVLAQAAKRGGRQNIFPVPKGDYWIRDGYNKLLRLLFSTRYYLTKLNTENKLTQLSVVDRIVEQAARSTQQQTIIMFPEGGRNTTESAKLRTGAFQISAKALFEQNVEVPVQPVELINMLPILKSGDIRRKEIASALWSAVKRVFIGKHVITVRFHEPKSALDYLSEIDTQSSDVIAGAMLEAFRRLMRLAQPHTSDQN